tara:strand:- start:342 stop:548 length:207 start_codon:yes stop_codon:yes gene_type:complete
MEFSFITIKRISSLDYPFYKFIIMTNEERKDKITQLHEQIVHLKLADSSVDTKLTIQKLQQELNDLTR